MMILTVFYNLIKFKKIKLSNVWSGIISIWIFSWKEKSTLNQLTKKRGTLGKIWWNNIKKICKQIYTKLITKSPTRTSYHVGKPKLLSLFLIGLLWRKLWVTLIVLWRKLTSIKEFRSQLIFYHNVKLFCTY